jgi:hypothetical protein
VVAPEIACGVQLPDVVGVVVTRASAPPTETQSPNDGHDTPAWVAPNVPVSLHELSDGLACAAAAVSRMAMSTTASVTATRGRPIPVRVGDVSFTASSP